MKRIVIVMISLSFALTTHAFYTTYLPSDRYHIPEQAINLALQFDGTTESITLEPSFHGTMENFSYLFLLPNEPTLTTSPSLIPPSLTSETGFTLFDTPPEEPLTLYETDILPLTDATVLTTWLSEQGYEYTETDEQIFAYYASLKTYHALLITMTLSEDTKYDDEGYYGTLPPLTITFATNYPLLPLQLLRTHMVPSLPIKLSILSNDMYYIPGVTTSFSKRVALEDTTPWLTVQTFTVIPNELTTDIFFTKGKDTYTIPKYAVARQINPQLFQAEEGIVPSTAPSLDDEVQEYTTLLGGTELLKWGSRGQAVIELQHFLNNLLSATLVTDGIWGTLTHEAVSQFQEEYSLTVDGIVGNQTRSFIQQLLQ